MGDISVAGWREAWTTWRDSRTLGRVTVEFYEPKAGCFVRNWVAGGDESIVTKWPLLKLFKERISLLHEPSFRSECLILK